MLAELKKKSIMRAIPLVLLFVIAGGVLFAAEFSNIRSLLRGHVKFETLLPDEINGDLIVEASINANFGAYMEEYSKNTKTNVTRTTDIYYVIWTGDDDSEDYKYMGIKVSASYGGQMDRMAEATYNYEMSDTIHFTGAVNKMSSEEYQYFREYFQESDWTDEEIDEYTLPYYISVGALTGGAATSAYVIFGIGIALIVFGVIILLYALSGGDVKAFQKEAATLGMSEMELEAEYAGARVMIQKDNLRIGRRLIFYMTGRRTRVIVNDKIVWAYQQSTTHRTNGIKTGTTYEILVYLLNEKKARRINMPGEEKAGEVLQYMYENIPTAVVGYTDELLSLFNKDYQGFLNLRYHNASGQDMPQ
ncbi:MAG: hypothetical protein HFI46_02945 [Lachnospiraceae bacterium]|nr:hypothetical protein [Lachnospiraceae bacterium]